MYESVTETQCSVVYADVTGFVEKKFRLSVDFLFVVEVYWSDNRTTYVKRSYKEFMQFHRDVTEYFRLQHEKGILITPVYIPNISGRYTLPRRSLVFFSPCNTISVSKKLTPLLYYELYLSGLKYFFLRLLQTVYPTS